MDGLQNQSPVSPQWQVCPTLQPQAQDGAQVSTEAAWQPQLQAAPEQLLQSQVETTSLVFMADPC